jgi:hypothetical protein
LKVVCQQGKTADNAFCFDRVFQGASVRQEDVYKDVAHDAIQDVLNGFNATVFAYGQTGAGKSFTMFGGAEDLAGIIPRATKHIFDHIASSTEAREWSVKVSCLFLLFVFFCCSLAENNLKLESRLLFWKSIAKLCAIY